MFCVLRDAVRLWLRCDITVQKDTTVLSKKLAMEVPYLYVRLLQVICVIWPCLADYACVCSYKDAVTIYSDADTSSTPLGKLNNWECKQLLTVQVAHTWMPLAYGHQVGYVKKDSKILLQMCNGGPPVGDVLTMMVTSTTTASTAIMTSSKSSPPQATKMGTPPPVKTSSTARPIPQSTFNISTAGDGNLALCPPNLLSERDTYHSVVGQFRNKCYALGINQPATWDYGEGVCETFGGHLVHIENQQEQDFVARFVKKYSPQQSVWLGLHDRFVEGVWTWSSEPGSSSYFNWATHHWKLLMHDINDCVILDPLDNGRWYDVPCGLFTQHIVVCQYLKRMYVQGTLAPRTYTISPNGLFEAFSQT